MNEDRFIGASGLESSAKLLVGNKERSLVAPLARDDNERQNRRPNLRTAKETLATIPWCAGGRAPILEIQGGGDGESKRDRKTERAVAAYKSLVRVIRADHSGDNQQWTTKTTEFLAAITSERLRIFAAPRSYDVVRVAGRITMHDGIFVFADPLSDFNRAVSRALWMPSSARRRDVQAIRLRRQAGRKQCRQKIEGDCQQQQIVEARATSRRIR